MKADTLVSSLGSSAIQTYVFPTDAWIASPFQTSTQSWTLTSITVLVGEGGIEPTTATLQLYSDNAGKPGVLLADLGSPTIASDLSLRTFALANALTLNPSTKYWVAVGASSATQELSIGVQDSSPFVFTGVPGASMSWEASEGTGSGTTPPSTWTDSYSNLALLFQVDGTPVTSSISRPTIQLVPLSTSNWAVQFPSQTGVTYILQATAALNATPTWTDISTNNGTGSLLSVPVAVTPATPQRFFRLRMPVP